MDQQAALSELQRRKLIRVTHAARLLGVTAPTLCAEMERRGLSLVQLSARVRCCYLDDVLSLSERAARSSSGEASKTARGTT